MDRPIGESWLVIRHPDQRPSLPAPVPGRVGVYRSGQDIVAVCRDEPSARIEAARLAVAAPHLEFRVERQPHMRIIESTAGL